VHEVRLGGIKAAIWQNQTEAGVRYNVTFERLYNQDGEWRSTGSFGRDDLLLLGKVADQAHTWIIEPETAEAGSPARTGRTVAGDLKGKSMPQRPVTAKAGG
jgi:hypothetical protein